MTGFVIEPTPSISIVISSPGFSQTGGSRNAPTPAGVPVMIRSPGSSVIACETNDDDLGDAEDHVRGVRVLHHLAVQDRADRQRLRIGNLARRHELADRQEGVERLAAHPLAVGELEVAPGDVVRDDVALDEVERVVDRDAARATADHDAELGLVVDLLARSRGSGSARRSPISVFGHLAKSSGRSGSATPCSSAWSR